MRDLVRREDVLEITDNLRKQDLGGANWIVDDIADAIRALPPSPRAAAAQRLANALHGMLGVTTEEIPAMRAAIEAVPGSSEDKRVAVEALEALAAWREEGRCKNPLHNYDGTICPDCQPERERSET